MTSFFCGTFKTLPCSAYTALWSSSKSPALRYRGIDPYAYLRNVLTNLPMASTIEILELCQDGGWRDAYRQPPSSGM
jgi:hypothetical protein